MDSLAAAGAALRLAALAVAIAAAGVAPSALAPTRARAAEPIAGSALWRTEDIPAQGAVAPMSVSFDAVGHGMLIWAGCCVKPAHPPTRPGTLPEDTYVGADVRQPTGGWQQVPNPPIQAIDSQIYLYGDGRAQQIGSEAVTTEDPFRIRFRALYSDGSAGGTFGAPRVLGQNGDISDSAANAAGDAIVAWGQANGGRVKVRVAERTAGRAFSSPRTFAGFGSPFAVALDAHGDRVLAWVTDGRLYARVRRRGRPWGSAQLAARLVGSTGSAALDAAINHSGTIVLAWETVSTHCEECAKTLQAGVALQTAKRPWKSFKIEHATVPANARGLTNLSAGIIPLVDTAGRTYIAWNGASRDSPAVKFARITAAGAAGVTTTLSAPVSAATIDDAAAGPRNELVVSWSDIHLAPSGLYPVYASLRRASGSFTPAVRLTPATVTGGSGLVAFEPVTGEAVVVSGIIAAGHPELQASISPPG